MIVIHPQVTSDAEKMARELTANDTDGNVYTVAKCKPPFAMRSVIVWHDKDGNYKGTIA